MTSKIKNIISNVLLNLLTESQLKHSLVTQNILMNFMILHLKNDNKIN